MNDGIRQPPRIADILAFNDASTELHCDHTVQVLFVRNFTLEGIAPLLIYHCLQNGVRPAISFGGYDTILQDLIALSSPDHNGAAEIVVLAIVLEQFDPSYGMPGWRATVAQEQLFGLFRAAAEKTDALLAINTFIPPYDADYGIAASVELSERVVEVNALNRHIRDFVQQNRQRFVLIDWDRLSRICGEQDAMDYRFWYMSKAPFKQPFLNLYALEILKVVRALKGKARKCLLLDCDNTLWGGVVGEDGLAGIRLDRHGHPGIIFYDFQKQLLRFHHRGVLLALVSKNNENDVWDVLDQHPDCLVKKEHIAAWRINWRDKAENIRSISEELNLSLDSFVFVDDNPTECELVRTMLPDVVVLQVPTRLHLFPRLLSRDGLFDTLSVSAEDRKRSAMYRAEVQRKE